jgi:hypothetical protein
MINLVFGFIAMLAMNVSKEVLSAFGLMNEKFESSNEIQKQQMINVNALDKAKGAEKGIYSSCRNSS